MKKAQRLSHNQIVAVDVTGTGQWVVGHIMDYNQKTGKVTIADAHGEPVVINRNGTDFYRATDSMLANYRYDVNYNPLEHSEPKEVPNLDSIENLHDEYEESEDMTLEEAQTFEEACAEDEGYKERLIKAKLENYTKHEARTSSGRAVVDCNDEVADYFRNADLSDLPNAVSYVLRERLGLDEIQMKRGTQCTSVQALTERYSHLNAGLRRMSLANLLRQQLKIAGSTLKGLGILEP